MKKLHIWDKWVILTRKEYNELKHTDSKVQEYKAIAEHGEIGKEIKKLTKKYAKYIGKWFETEDGYPCKIKGVKYDRGTFGYTPYNSYKFEAYVPGWEDYIDISFYDVTEKKIKQITVKEARKCYELD